VLLVAEAANPEWTSVPLVGWSHSEALSRVADVHLVTQTRNRAAIERFGWREGIEFTAIDSEAIAAPAYKLAALLAGGKNKGWTTLTAVASLTYPYFEYLIWKKFRDDLKGGKFDIVHRLTPLSPTASSFLAKRCAKLGVPFVMGPLNGGIPWPKEFEERRKAEKEWLSYVRGIYKVLPGRRSTLENASAILVASKATSDDISEDYASKKIYIPENGINPDLFSRPDLQSKAFKLPLKLSFVGRLVPYKGLDILIDAIAPLLKQGTVTLDVFGDGPMMPQIKQMVAELEVTESVKLWGFVKQDFLSKGLQDSHLFTFPSIREFGGAVVLEAMALGAVPVVVNYGGPSELATPETGFLVELGDREFLVNEFRRIVTDIVKDPESLRGKSEKAVERIFSLFTWDTKAQQVLEVYQWLLNQKDKKPDFGQPLTQPVAIAAN
jgi:glycosyltransferase involved in cell wall biosynthesis